MMMLMAIHKPATLYDAYLAMCELPLLLNVIVRLAPDMLNQEVIF